MATEPPQHVAPPMLLSRPAEAPPALEPLRGTDVIRSLHLDWARMHGAPSGPATIWQRLLRKVRRSLPFGAADRELIGALIRGIDLVATRCDEMADRLATTETLTSEVTRSFGHDITHLRADLMTLQAALDNEAQPDR
ncbi:MAG TPA: hypothetical protein VGH31_01660 [Acidimicrobiales bacterium]